MLKSKLSSFLTTICGVLVALFVAEIAMRPISFQIVRRNKMEIRQYQEGVSVSHFFWAAPVSEWYRSTGNDMIMGAQNLVLIGDSYLAAKHIPDHSNMGALLEDRFRAEGEPLNVIQFGLSGGAAATYSGFADKVLATFKPQWVIVLLNDSDLGKDAVTKLVQFGLKISPTGGAQIYKIAPPKRNRLSRRLEKYSALLQTIHMRWDMLFSSESKNIFKNKNQDLQRMIEMLPRTSVTLLKEAYGNKLIVIFFPEINMLNGPKPGKSEMQLEKECLAQGIPFVSCRNEFIKLKQNFIYVRGFHNTLPGEGHLNELGHRVMAEIIWKFLNRLNEQTQTAQKDPIGEKK
jgi:lysophospholipase L1-like esterase